MNRSRVGILPARKYIETGKMPVPLPIPDSRFPIPDSRFPIPDSRFLILNS
ncbi:MAG: hypothetical protein F6J98_12140 [Moorea sp. SIO4G2]|nr:hypothetical protein [Moorena sp. SIO4G2]NEQ80464.1 hypothetical protein [Moorena sp. SIO2I5]